MKAEGGRRKAEDMLLRTKAFALRIIHLHTALPKTVVAATIGKQLLRSGMSVGAHYREAQRARTPAEFLSKIEVAQQELDETTYWLELIIEAQLMPSSRLTELVDESDQLQRVLSTIARKRRSSASDSSAFRLPTSAFGKL